MESFFQQRFVCVSEYTEECRSPYPGITLQCLLGTDYGSCFVLIGEIVTFVSFPFSFQARKRLYLVGTFFTCQRLINRFRENMGALFIRMQVIHKILRHIGSDRVQVYYLSIHFFSHLINHGNHFCRNHFVALTEFFAIDGYRIAKIYFHGRRHLLERADHCLHIFRIFIFIFPEYRISVVCPQLYNKDVRPEVECLLISLLFHV